MHHDPITIARGLGGILIMLGLAWAISTHRRRINWRLVVSGVLLQFVIAFLVLKVSWVHAGFEMVSGFFIELMNFTNVGARFVFGDFLMDSTNVGVIFAVQILPTIIFFSALTSVLYYLNILQYVVYAFAWVMTRTMRLSGAESLAAAANIFVGQTEAPLVVKPYLEKMTRSEILALMTGGMATIAGGVLVAYIGLLGGEDPVQKQLFATHLLLASIMSAPAALVVAKIMLPETEPVNTDLFVPRHRMGSNLLDAITLGTTQGVKLAVNVGAMLLVFIAMIAMLNYVVATWIGGPTGLNERIAAHTGGTYPTLSLEYLFGLLFAPLAWAMGVPSGDLLAVGQLLGEKLVINEFKAYQAFSVLRAEGALQHPRAVIIATYALCGFANFGSIGIQIGGISAIAPGQRTTLAALGVKSLIAGTLACFITACIAGIIV